MVTPSVSCLDWVEQAAPMLDWVEGETLFSLCSRLHQMWGHCSSWQTTQLLFGHRRAGTHHDLPSRLQEFDTRTAQRYGPASELAMERTILRFYRPFVPSAGVRSAAETMRGASVAHLKFRLGLLTSRFRANQLHRVARGVAGDRNPRCGLVAVSRVPAFRAAISSGKSRVATNLAVLLMRRKLPYRELTTQP